MAWRSEYCYEPRLSRRHPAEYVPLDPERLVIRYLVLGVGQVFDSRAQFEDLDVVGAVGPVVVAAHNYVAPAYGMAVIAEIPALEFKFDMDALPAIRRDLALGLAIGESAL